MKLDPEHKTAQQLIGRLIGVGMTLTDIAKKSGSSISTISRTYTGQYKDIDYQVGKKLEEVIKAYRVRK